jgi:peptidoglycan/xylan/chitin deacetylase (PgdA/CDA1 family)
VLGKKKLLARVGAFCGATRFIEALPRRPSLQILNYHRVGDAGETPHDSGAFSCSAAEFDWQIRHLKRNFPIVDLEGVVDIVHGRATPSRACVALTFDDGYRDNFELAFPILRAHGVSAAFFLPTAFIGTDLLPWWDRVALIVKTTTKRRVVLSYPKPAEFDLTHPHRENSIKTILLLFKRAGAADLEKSIDALASACGVEGRTSGAERCFMNWDEAREMQGSGMRFGSHSHTHEILSKLPFSRQLDELRTSRRILESELGRSIDTLSYPEGKPETFTDETHAALREAGYGTAFSFYTGVNIPGNIQPYNVLRDAVDDGDRASFRLRVALRAATRHELF